MNRSKEKPICPKCGSKTFAEILYGEPSFTESFERRLKSRKITLGGCVISDDSPKYECGECGERFGSYL